jgi:nitrate reductase delta subunit
MEAIRKAGLRLIFEHGFAAMSLRQLAAEVGIQSGSLYNHISTKQELLFELIRDHINELLRQLDRALQGKQRPIDKLRAFTAFHVTYHMTRKREVFIANSELRSLEPKNYQEIVALRGAYDQAPLFLRAFLFFFYLTEGIDRDNQLRGRATKAPFTSMFAGEWVLKNPLNAPTQGVTAIPRDRLRWSIWARGLAGEALVRFVRDEVFAFHTDIAEKAALNFMDGARLSIDEPTVLTQVVTLIDRLRGAGDLHAEADYVELFDRGRRTALHLFEHVHGDSRDRGQAMVDLTKTYERAGLYLSPGELPDYLPAVLEFASTQPPQAAREFLSEIAHVVRAIFSALLERGSPYASALAAVLDLAGEPADRVALPAEPAIDETWIEPEAFGGCATQGQSRPNETQPVHIVRPARASQRAPA